MIWNEELPTTSLDQSAGVLVFHNVELSRLQQLAQTLAERVGTLVEQNEKSLDQKQGGSGAWGDRAEGAKGGRKEGEQTQERNRRSDRARGGATRGKKFISPYEDTMHSIDLYRSSRRSWGAFCSRLGEPDDKCTNVEVYRTFIFCSVIDIYHQFMFNQSCLFDFSRVHSRVHSFCLPHSLDQLDFQNTRKPSILQTNSTMYSMHVLPNEKYCTPPAKRS